MKRGPIARIILYLFFAGLIAVPLFLSRKSSQREAAAAGGGENAALNRYGFYLTEDSKEAGVHFVHQAPVLDPQLAPIIRFDCRL